MIRLALLAASAWALHREFAHVVLAELLRQLASYGWPRLAIALAITATSFLLLGAVELLALRASSVSRRRVGAGRALASAFVAHSLSQSIGVALLTGAMVRVRSYTRRGVGAMQIGHVTALVTLSITLGLLVIGAWAFIVATAPLVILGRPVVLRPVGVLLALVVIAFIVWSATAEQPAIPALRWRLPRPALRTTAGLVSMATLDWILTGAVLIVLLPRGINIEFWHFMRFYVIAQMVGMMSHVPAGAGVFELTLLALIVASYPALRRESLLAAIVAYRFIYYLVPLMVAVAVGGLTELHGLRSSRRAKLPLVADSDGEAAA